MRWQLGALIIVSAASLVGCGSETRSHAESAEAVREALAIWTGEDIGPPVRLVDFDYRPPVLEERRWARWRGSPTTALHKVPTRHRLRVNASKRAVGFHAYGLQRLMHPSSASPTNRGAEKPVFRTVAAEPGSHPLDPAIASFQRAVDRQPYVARYQNDLAAALWLRGTALGSIEDLLRALEHADMAVELSPLLPEARFNLALVLDELNTWGQAIRRYEEFLKVEPNSDWAIWTRERLRDLRAIDVIRETEDFKQALWQAGIRSDEQRLESLVRQGPQLAREYAQDELLPGWARRQLDTVRPPGSAETWFAAARAIGRAVGEVSGDLTVDDCLTAVDYVSLRSSLPQALASYGEALVPLRELDYESALPHLKAAGPALQRAGCPISRWVSYYQTLYDYQRSDYEPAYLSFNRLATQSDAERYPSLEVRLHRVMALIQRVKGSYPASLRHYDTALEIAFRTGELPAALGQRVSKARVFARLGRWDDAWAELHGSLNQRRILHRGEREYLLFVGGAAVLRAQGRHRAAESFILEATDVARQRGMTVAEVEALRELAWIRAELGREGTAIDAIRDAKTRIATLSSDSVRAFLTLENLRLEATVLARHDPQLALRRATEAVEMTRRAGYQQILPDALVVQARLLRKRDRLDEAAECLAEATAEVEHQWEQISDPRFRVSFSRQRHSVYEEQIRLEIARKDQVAAYLAAERGRVGLFRAWLRDVAPENARRLGSSTTKVVHPKIVARRLPEGSGVIALRLVDEQLVAWTLAEGSFQQVLLPASRSEIETSITELHRSWNSETPEFLCTLRKLYAQVLQPLEPAFPISKLKTITFVPGPGLGSVPFGALRRPSGRFLIQDRLIMVSPTVTRALSALERVPPTRPPSTVAAIGDPAFDDVLFAELSRLPGARLEALEVYRSYKSAGSLLLGSAATKSSTMQAIQRVEAIHIASHALIEREDPLRSRILLASDESGDHGSLAGLDLLDLDLEGVAVLVLSGCKTAASHEGFMGLAEPALLAGVRSVVGTLRPVEDRSQIALVVAVHQHLMGGKSAPEALALAIRDSIEGSIEAATEPSKWSSFQVVVG